MYPRGLYRREVVVFVMQWGLGVSDVSMSPVDAKMTSADKQAYLPKV